MWLCFYGSRVRLRGVIVDRLLVLRKIPGRSCCYGSCCNQTSTVSRSLSLCSRACTLWQTPPATSRSNRVGGSNLEGLGSIPQHFEQKAEMGVLRIILWSLTQGTKVSRNYDSPVPKWRCARDRGTIEIEKSSNNGRCSNRQLPVILHGFYSLANCVSIVYPPIFMVQGDLQASQ